MTGRSVEISVEIIVGVGEFSWKRSGRTFFVKEKQDKIEWNHVIEAINKYLEEEKS